MAGLGHADFEGRIQCPHCGTTDCAGIKWPDGEQKYDPASAQLICCLTNVVAKGSAPE